MLLHLPFILQHADMMLLTVDLLRNRLPDPGLETSLGGSPFRFLFQQKVHHDFGVGFRESGIFGRGRLTLSIRLRLNRRFGVRDVFLFRYDRLGGSREIDRQGELSDVETSARVSRGLEGHIAGEDDRI